jgi:hypothetical protein
MTTKKQKRVKLFSEILQEKLDRHNKRVAENTAAMQAVVAMANKLRAEKGEAPLPGDTISFSDLMRQPGNNPGH